MARPKGATPRKAPSTMSFFAAMLVGMILTVGIGLFVYLWIDPCLLRLFVEGT